MSRAGGDDIMYINSKTGEFMDRGNLPNFISRDGTHEYWLTGTPATARFSKRDGKAPNLTEHTKDATVHAWVRGSLADPEFFNAKHSHTIEMRYLKDGYWTRAWVQGGYRYPIYVIRKRGRPNWIDSKDVKEWRVGDYYAPAYAERYELPAVIDAAHGLRKYASKGKLVGALPVKYRVPWSGCSKHAKLQLGGTCASAAALNLFLNTPLLRNACISRTRELFREQPHLESAWRSGILSDSEENFRHVLLQTMYYELCIRHGERVPSDVSFSSHCMFSSLMGNLGRGWNHYIRSSSMVLDLMYAAGFDHVFFNIPELQLDDAMLSAPDPESTYVVYTRLFDAEGSSFGETRPEFEKGPISVIGSLITFARIGASPVTTAAEAGAAHAVVGLMCEAATPLIFDSNTGDVPVNWMQDATPFFADMTRAYGKLLFVSQMFLYAAIEVNDAAIRRPFAAACAGTAAPTGAAKGNRKLVLTMLERLKLSNALTKSEPAEFYWA